jgi:hypothetical protein
LKRSTTFVLVPCSDSVYKKPKTHFDLLLLKLLHGGKLLSNVNSKEKGEGFMSHLYSTLGCCGRGGKADAAGEGRAEAAQGVSRGGAGHERRRQEKNDRRKELVTVVYNRETKL